MSLKKRFLIFVLFSVIFLSAFCGGYLYAQSSTEITIEPKSFTTASSYIVFKEASIFYLLNGTNSEIETSSTNDTNIITWAIGNASNVGGGSVTIKTASYNATVTLKDNLTLYIDKGASGITVNIDSGATAWLYDHHNDVIKYWSDGTLELDLEKHSTLRAFHFLIEIDGSTVKAFNGTTGVPTYSGTNARSVLQSAIADVDALGGGTIFIKTGLYEISYDDGALSSTTNLVFLKGEGETTQIKAVDNTEEDTTFSPIDFTHIDAVNLKYAININDLGDLFWTWYDLTVYERHPTSADWIFGSLEYVNSIGSITPDVLSVAINGKTGEWQEVTDIGVFINSNTAAGDYIYFEAGDWYIDTAIVPKSQQTFEGSGWKTRLIIREAVNGFQFTTGTLSYATFRAFQLRGERSSSPYDGLSGFNFTSAHADTLWTRIWIHRVSQYGFSLKGMWTSTIEQCPVENTGVGSIYLEAGTEGGQIAHNNFQRYSFCNVSNIRFHHNKFYPGLSTHPSLALGSSADNCVIDHNNFCSQLEACEGHINLYAGVSSVWIDDNSFNGGSGSGINFTGATDNATIINNYFDPYSLGTIVDGGYAHTGLVVRGNTGSFLTEGGGLATDLANGDTIAHGLAGTPDMVQLTSLNATYGGYGVTVAWDYGNTDGTNISVDIYWSHNGTAITDSVIAVSWFAEYYP